MSESNSEGVEIPAYSGIEGTSPHVIASNSRDLLTLMESPTTRAIFGTGFFVALAALTAFVAASAQ